MLLAIIAAAATGAASPPVITRPDWLSKPTGNDVYREYPARVRLLNVPASAILQCRVDRDGRVVDCQVQDETPLNLGVGAAALRLSKLFRMRPQMENGKPVDNGIIRVPVVFHEPGPDSPEQDSWARAYACYGQAAKVAEEKLSPDAWRATASWAIQMMRLIVAVDGRPSDVEEAEREARLAATAGTLTVPPNSDLKACIASIK